MDELFLVKRPNLTLERSPLIDRVSAAGVCSAVMAKYASLRAFVDSFPRRVTQQEIAAQLGIPESSFYRYLGGAPASPELALRLSRQYAIDLEALLEPPVPAGVAR